MTAHNGAAKKCPEYQKMCVMAGEEAEERAIYVMKSVV